ncbi:MAG TPA: ABC transporter permease [Syntrophorhabdaceae bacterium]|nr:ABC transporter permease [Syntrophorhabdaceae bacterium]
MKPYLIVLLLLILWTAGSFFGIFNAYLLPPPWKIAKTASKLVLNGVLIHHTAVSLLRIIAGFTVTICFAFPMGLLVGLRKESRAIWEPPLNFMRHIPPLAMIPMLILWFGIGESAKMAIIILSAFFPVFLNTASGVANCDPKLIEVGKTLGYNQPDRILHIILPAAVPAILVGIQLGLGYAWRSLIGAELIAAASGLGYMIIEAEQLSRPDTVIVGILVIGILGLLIDIVLKHACNRLMPWSREEKTYVQG